MHKLPYGLNSIRVPGLSAAVGRIKVSPWVNAPKIKENQLVNLRRRLTADGNLPDDKPVDGMPSFFHIFEDKTHKGLSRR
jgi:hypothetical protein